MIDIQMPRLSENMSEGKLLRWCVQEGARVNAGDVIAEVETDKANMEIEALESGIVEALTAKAGDMIAVGASMGRLRTGEAATDTPLVVDASPVAKPRKDKDFVHTNASPLAIILAEQLGINLTDVPGTGPNGRILKEDVSAYAQILKQEGKLVGAATPVQPAPRPVVEANAEASSAEVAIGNDGDLDNQTPVPEAPVIEAIASMQEITTEGTTLVPEVDEMVAVQTEEPEAAEASAPSSPVIDLFEPRKASIEDIREPIAAGPSGGPQFEDAIAREAQRQTNQIGSGGSEIHVAVLINMSALSQSTPILTQRFARESDRPEEALTPVYMRAAAIALHTHHKATHADRTGAAIGFSVAGDRDFIFCEVPECNTRPLSEIFQEYQEQRKKARAITSLGNDAAGASLAILNLAHYGIEEYIGLGNLKYTALLSLGRVKESAVMNSGRVERAHLMKATLSVRSSAWTSLNAVSFLSEFQQLLEHPVLLLGF